MGVPDRTTRTVDKNLIRTLARQKGYGLIESFSGPGGMSLGLEEAGFNLLYAFDYDPKTVDTHRRNLGNRCFQRNATEVSGAELLEICSLRKGELALFSGGPPCQGFSKQKRGAHLGDERNNLVSEYIRLIKEIEPRFFLFENVAIFGQKRGLKHIREMQTVLENYTLYPHFYNSADYGLAQTRERFIMVGCRNDLGIVFQLPPPTVSKWKTVGEALAGIPEPPMDYKDHPDYPNHQRARVTDLNIKRFSFVKQGGGWQDIPYELRLPCHQKVDTSSGGWPDVYGRLQLGGQCPTITGGFDSFTRGRYGHPIQDRPITPREAARLQGFPDWFVFEGTRGDVRSQIGNAVPPPLAEAVGCAILDSLLMIDGALPNPDAEETCVA